MKKLSSCSFFYVFALPDGCSPPSRNESFNALQCSGHGICNKTDTGKYCKCHSGYTGLYCEHSKCRLFPRRCLHLGKYFKTFDFVFVFVLLVS